MTATEIDSMVSFLASQLRAMPDEIAGELELSTDDTERMRRRCELAIFDIQGIVCFGKLELLSLSQESKR